MHLISTGRLLVLENKNVRNFPRDFSVNREKGIV